MASKSKPQNAKSPAGATGGSPADAAKVLQRFLEAANKGDTKTAKSLSSKATAAGSDFTPPGGDQMKWTLGKPALDGADAVVPVDMKMPDGSPPPGVPPSGAKFVLIREDNQWKVDAGKTMEKTLGVNLEQVMSTMVDAMGQAMKGMGEAMAEGMSAALGSGSAEASSSPAQLTADEPTRGKSKGSPKGKAPAASPKQAPRRRK